MRLMKYTSNLITALIISVIVNSSLASILSNSTIDQVNNLFDMPESYSFVSPAFKKLSTPEKKKVITILAIDGGGMYGLFPLKALKQLEQSSGQPISDLFDVMVGTSTGSIVVSTLATPDNHGKPKYTVDDLISFYVNNGKVIFHRSIWHSLRTLWGLIGPIYPSDGLVQIYDKTFSNVKLSQLKSHVIIPSGVMLENSPLWFNGIDAKHNSDLDFYVKDIVASATSAPTVFSPYKLTNITNTMTDYGCDAGLFVNNPSLQAYVDAKLIYPDQKYIIVSLGTGMSPENTVLDQPNVFEKMGLIRGVLPFMSQSMDFHSKQTDYQMRLLAEDKANKIMAYYRINLVLTEGKKSIFSGDPENLKHITQLANKMVEDKQDKISSMIGVINQVKSK